MLLLATVKKEYSLERSEKAVEDENERFLALEDQGQRGSVEQRY